jgi:hypothetical protein
MPEYNGWEKLRHIGGGGQSEVYLARSPIESTPAPVGIGDRGQFADAAYLTINAQDSRSQSFQPAGGFRS